MLTQRIADDVLKLGLLPNSRGLHDLTISSLTHRTRAHIRHLPINGDRYITSTYLINAGTVSCQPFGGIIFVEIYVELPLAHVSVTHTDIFFCGTPSLSGTFLALGICTCLANLQVEGRQLTHEKA